MNTYFRGISIIVAVLLIPVIPFVLFGEKLEFAISQWLVSDELSNNPLQVFAVAVALLTTDIFLPIPSSVVCTVCGKILGIGWGIVAGWIGLSLSAWLGYWLSSTWGWQFVNRFTRPDAIEAAQLLNKKWSSFSLLLLRPIPILAEASILLAGVYRLPKNNFWPPILIGNFVVATCFVFLGKLSAEQGWFGIAVPLSICMPLALLFSWLLVWRVYQPNSIRDSRSSD